MADWMAWAIFGAVLVVCIVAAVWVGGEHAPGDSVLRGAFKGRTDTSVETARGMAKAEGSGDATGGSGFLGPN